MSHRIVPGHKLPAGADTEEELRAKVQDAGVLIGIITPASAESSFVLFELGARWGCNRPLIPIVAAGFAASDLREPLKSKNALLGYDSNDMHQLVHNVSGILGLGHEPASAYNKHVIAFSKACKVSSKKSSAKVNEEAVGGFKIYVRGVQIENGAVVQLDDWYEDIIKLRFDFNNSGSKPIKKGAIQAYVVAPGFSGVELLLKDGVDTATLQSTIVPEGQVLYRLPDFPLLLPGAWETWTVAMWSYERQIKANQTPEIKVSVASHFGQEEIAFKLKLLPKRKA